MPSTSRSPSSGAEPPEDVQAPYDRGDRARRSRETGTGLVATVVGAMVLVTLLLFALQVGLLLLARSETQAVLGQATSNLALPSPTPFALRARTAATDVRHELGRAGRAATVEIWRTSRAVHGLVRLRVPTLLPWVVTDPLGLERVRAAAVARLTLGGRAP